MPTAVSFAANGMSFQTSSAIFTLYCENVISECTSAPEPFVGNTGSNMTVMLTSDVISGLPELVEGA